MSMLQSPFGNEAEQAEIDGMTIENRVDRISLYGSLEITKDKAGLEKAIQLSGLLNRIVGELVGADLPEKIITTPTTPVDNPFGE